MRFFFDRCMSYLVLPVILAVFGTGLGLLLTQGQAQPPAARPGAAPAADAERVYRQLFSRIDQDGKPYDREELEPPFVPGSKFLTDGASHQQALAVLDDFLKGAPETKMTPLERAVFQHDLWAVLAATHAPKSAWMKSVAASLRTTTASRMWATPT
jgi:hypothetical protein